MNLSTSPPPPPKSHSPRRRAAPSLFPPLSQTLSLSLKLFRLLSITHKKQQRRNSAPGTPINGAQALAVLEAMQFTQPASSFPSPSSSSSPSLALNDARESFAQGDDAVFHVVLDGTSSGGTGLAFVAAAPAASGAAGPGALLDEARGRTALALAGAGVSGDGASSLRPYALDAVVGPLLAAAAAALSETRGGAARRLDGDLEEVRQIMSRNLDAALDRGERLELLVAKTDTLSGDAGIFARRAGSLARGERWREAKGRVAVAAAAAVVLYLVAASFCGVGMECAWRKKGGGGGGP